MATATLPTRAGAQSDGLTDYDLITRGTLNQYREEIDEARTRNKGYTDYEGESGYQRPVYSPKQATDAPMSPRTIPVEAADLVSTSDGGGGADVVLVDGDDRTTQTDETPLPTNQKRAADESVGNSARAPDAKRVREVEYQARQRLVRDVGQPPLLTVHHQKEQDVRTEVEDVLETAHVVPLAPEARSGIFRAEPDLAVTRTEAALDAIRAKANKPAADKKTPKSKSNGKGAASANKKDSGKKAPAKKTMTKKPAPKKSSGAKKPAATKKASATAVKPIVSDEVRPAAAALDVDKAAVKIAMKKKMTDTKMATKTTDGKKVTTKKTTDAKKATSKKPTGAAKPTSKKPTGSKKAVTKKPSTGKANPTSVTATWTEWHFGTENPTKKIAKELGGIAKKPAAKKLTGTAKKPVPKKLASSAEKPVPKKLASSAKKPVPKKLTSSAKKPVPKKVTPTPTNKKRAAPGAPKKKRQPAKKRPKASAAKGRLKFVDVEAAEETEAMRKKEAKLQAQHKDELTVDVSELGVNLEKDAKYGGRSDSSSEDVSNLVDDTIMYASSDASDDDLSRASHRRLMTQDSDDELMEQLNESDPTGVSSAVAALSKHPARRRRLSQKPKKKAAQLAEGMAWSSEDIPKIVANPEEEWPAYKLAVSQLHERLRDIVRCSGKKVAVKPEDVTTLATSFFAIARCMLTPEAATANAEQMMNIIKNTPDEVRVCAQDMWRDVFKNMRVGFKKDPEFGRDMIQCTMCDTFDSKYMKLPPDGDKECRCVWTGEVLKPGSNVWRIALSKSQKNQVTFFYVSQAPELPNLYLQGICTLRTVAMWPAAFQRYISQWQERENLSESMSADMRMQRFIQADSTVELFTEALCAYFASRHVILCHIFP